MSQLSHPSLRIRRAQTASADDLLLAGALISAHGDAISMVHVPFLERLPLGPQDAFTRCVDEASLDVLT